MALEEAVRTSRLIYVLSALPTDIEIVNVVQFVLTVSTDRWLGLSARNQHSPES
jgi:hypothetical protein